MTLLLKFVFPMYQGVDMTVSSEMQNEQVAAVLHVCFGGKILESRCSSADCDPISVSIE